MMADIKKLEIDAKEAKRIAREAEEALSRAKREAHVADRDALKPLAEEAHDLLCRFNHTDGCSWGYEKNAAHGDAWTGQYSAHRRWLDRVWDILRPKHKHMAISMDELRCVLDGVRLLKDQVPRAMSIISDLKR